VDEAFKSSLWWMQRTATVLNINVCVFFYLYCTTEVLMLFWTLGTSDRTIRRASSPECEGYAEHYQAAIGDSPWWTPDDGCSANYF
jgi:hypothetical protein